MENSFLKIIYTLTIGIMVSVFIGTGVNTFYESPTPPDYPEKLSYSENMQEEQNIKLQAEYDKNYKVYESELEHYYKKASAIIILLATIIIIGAVLFEDKIKGLSEGVILGGFLTLIYGIILGFSSQDNKFTFGAVTVGLILTLYLGYRQFFKSKH